MTFRWVFAWVLSAGFIAASAGGQSSGIAIDDSLFQPIRLPETMSFGYPPNEVHVPRIVELMRQRQFDSLDTMFDGLAADVRRDVRNEIRFSDALGAAQRNEPAILASLDSWIAARPRSAHARVARAEYHYAAAWRRRGTAYLPDTPPERIRGMVESAQLAVQDVTAALAIDTTHLVAHEIGIGVMQLAGSHNRAIQLMAHGLAIHRGSYGLLNAFMNMLWPRWGGTEELMTEFAQRASEDSASNPRLVTLRGAVYETRAYDSTLARNYAGAIRELNKALAFGPERRFLKARGRAYFRLGAYEYAFQDLRLVMMERSQDSEVLGLYGRTLVELATRARPAIRPTILARATEVLQLAVYLDPSDGAAQAALNRTRRLVGQ